MIISFRNTVALSTKWEKNSFKTSSSQNILARYENSLACMFTGRTTTKVVKSFDAQKHGGVCIFIHLLGTLKNVLVKVRKSATIRNRYNQAPHLTQDNNGKVPTSKLDITKESQAVSPFPAGDHKASTNRRA